MVDQNERLAVLETEIRAQKEHNTRIEAKVDAMYDVIMQLRGAKWMGWFIAAAVGFSISNITTIFNFLQGK